MKRIGGILLLAALMASSVEARIGETREQTAERFDLKPGQMKGEAFSIRTNGVELTFWLINDVVVREMYRKDSGEFTVEQFNTIAGNQPASAKCVRGAPPKPEPFKSSFKDTPTRGSRAEKPAPKAGNTLEFVSQAWLDQEAKQAKANGELKGF
jgi:hypothetical protein